MNKSILLIFTFIILLFNTKNLYPFGIGAYGSYNEDKEKVIANSYTKRVGAGLIFDTSVTRDKLINFRFSFNYERNFADYYRTDSGNSGEISLEGMPEGFKSREEYNFYNDAIYNRYGVSFYFGFGIIRNKFIRLWAGPELLAGYKHLKLTRKRITYRNMVTYHYGSGEFYYFSNFESNSYNIVDGGVGITVGLNINLNNSVSLTLQSGARLKASLTDGFYGSSEWYAQLGFLGVFNE